MALVEQIAAKAKEIKTDGYPMSIGEVLSLYRDGDIDIHPEFQRIFRWNADQKARLIESILLGIPIPPIFVSQRGDGVWDVIDGVQRLSTILEFVGVYRDHEQKLLPPLILRATEYLPDLEGCSWEIGPKVFSDTLRRDIKRAKLEFRIIRKESDETPSTICSSALTPAHRCRPRKPATAYSSCSTLNCTRKSRPCRPTPTSPPRCPCQSSRR